MKLEGKEVVKLTEEEMIQKAKLGDNIAIEEILKKYKFLVKIIARKYFLMGGEKEDLAQEGMIGLYKAILNYSEAKGLFKSFARLCIESQIQTAIKLANRQKHKILNNSLSIEFANCQGLLPTENPEQILVERENQEERFRKINDVLSSLEKKVLKNYLDGLSYVEIANNLKTSTKSIDNAISRIKIKLKVKR